MATVQHSFIDDVKMVEDEKSKPKLAIVVIGNTGVGKSSLISLFCGNHKIIGHSPWSHTTQPDLYRDQQNRYRYWLDSQGLNDSTGIDDDKILKNLFQTLHNEKINHIKIIWCIDDGDICRAGNDLQCQANYIQSFNENSAWNSCVIIKKKGEPQQMTDIDGVIAAAKKFGSDIKYGDHRLFGFTYLDKINMNNVSKLDKTLRVIVNTTKQNSEQRKKMLTMAGYLSNEDIIKEVNKRISNIPTLPINFRRQKCIKCGCKGDERFIYEYCHICPEYYHPKQLIQFHSGKLNWKHTRSLVKEITSRQTNYNSSYHPGTLKNNNWSCCGGIYKTAWNWREMGMEMPTGGCKYNEIVHYRMIYACCGDNKLSTGCLSEYSCCGANKLSTGCKRKYKCCDNDENSQGCGQRCSNAKCKTLWGTGPGCIKTDKMVGLKEGIDIYVKAKNGMWITISGIEQHDTIKNLKQKIADQAGKSVQGLYFHGKCLMDERKVYECGLYSGCSVRF